MANAVNLKCTNTIDDNDVSNGKIDNFDESSVVQQENSLNYHPSPLVTNNCSGEVVQFNGNIDEVSENHRDIIPNDDNKLIITLNSNGGKKKKKIRKSFGFFFGNSFSIGGRISSDVNFQMALEELYLKNHIESNVNQTITNSIAFKNYSNNFTVENYGNKKSQQFNLFEWSNNDPSKQSNVNQKTSITNSVASQIYSNNFMGEYYRDKKRQQFNLFECLNNGFSHQIKYPLLSTNGCVEFRGSNIDHNKFLENRSIVSIGSNFGKNFAMEQLIASNATLTANNATLTANNATLTRIADNASTHILQTNNVLVQALVQANKDLKDAMMQANNKISEANDKLYNLAIRCGHGRDQMQPENFGFGNRANEQQFADDLFGNLQQPNRDGVQQVFVEQQQNPEGGHQVFGQQPNLVAGQVFRVQQQPVAGQQVGQQQQNPVVHGFGQPRY